MIKEGKSGLSTIKSLDSDKINEAFLKAIQNAELTPPDPHVHFANKSNLIQTSIPVEAHILDESNEDIYGRLSKIEKLVLSLDKRIKKVVRFELKRALSNRELVSTKGVQLSDQSSSVSFGFEVLVDDGVNQEVAWDGGVFRTFQNLNLESMALAASKKALMSLGGKPISSGFYNAVITPGVSIQFMDLLEEALSAENVALGRSFLAEKLNEPISSQNIILTDNPFLENGSASALFDDEGTPHQTTTLIENGILKNYFYDLKSSKKAGVQSTGHGIKSALASLPSPKATNLYIKDGQTDEKEFLSSEKLVFQIEEVMGLHMANGLTGEFSLGASGFLFENGKFKQAVRGVTVSGNLREFFKKIIGVGNNLKWFGNFGSPSLLVSNLQIAGN